MVLLILLLTISFVFPNAFEKLKELYETTKTIKVSFIQEVKYDWYPKPDVSKGIFYASKGGKVRIDYFSPDRISIFVDKNKVVLVNYEERVVYIESIKRNTSPVIASLFLLSEPPHKVFKPVGEFKKKNKTVLILKPLKKDENVKEVKVYLSKEGEILGLKTYDSQGSEISINFIKVKRNYLPSSTLFVPRIPEGFKVQRYE